MDRFLITIAGEFNKEPKPMKAPVVLKTKKDVALEKRLELKSIYKAKRTKELDVKKEITNLAMTWIGIMAHKKLDNELDETFALQNVKKEAYGFSCRIEIAMGLSFTTLESPEMIKTIEHNLECKFIADYVPKTNYMEAKFITEDIPVIDFEPYADDKGKKLAPYELYVGTSIDGKPIIASMLKYPHAIVQGSTNMGKTKLIDSICTNLIVSNSPEDVSLYFIQVDKSDQVIYRLSKHTRAYADNVHKALAVTNYLKAIVEARDKTLRPMIENGICENIEGFNRVYKKFKQSKFSYIYLIIDEYSSLMPADGGNKEKRAIKNEIQENMERLIQIGRYVGIYIIIGLQRSTVDKLPSFIKALCNTITTFKVNNERSSFVAIDSNEATSLVQREFIMKTDKQVYGKTTTLTPAMILHYIEPSRWSSSQYTDFLYDSWLEAPEEKKGKKTKESKNKKRKEERYGIEAKNNELTEEELKKLLSKKGR